MAILDGEHVDPVTGKPTNPDPKAAWPEEYRQPATDQEVAGIAAWNCDCRFQDGRDRHTRDCLMLFGPRLIARIDQDRARIAAQAQEIERLNHQLRLIWQVTGDYCNGCGWAMKFENDCMNCENARLQARVDEMEELYGELQDWIGEQMTPPKEVR